MDLELTAFQKTYLTERPRYGSNSACARAIGIHPNTVNNWRHQSTDFVEAESRMTQAINKAIEDPDTFVRDKLRPRAMQRMYEILGEPVTPGTDKSRVNTIRQAATDTLKGTGDLKPETQGAGIAVIINEFRAEGGRYVPSWKTRAIDAAE